MISGKNGPYDNVKSHKKKGFTLSLSLSLSRKYSFGKTTGVGESQIEPPSFSKVKASSQSESKLRKQSQPMSTLSPT